MQTLGELFGKIALAKKTDERRHLSNDSVFIITSKTQETCLH